ncbi:MAG: hypothetical protein AB2L07_12500 [Thermoanaerobaculaceae bacterium]
MAWRALRGATAVSDSRHDLGHPLVVLGHQALDRLRLDVLEGGVPQHRHHVVLVLPDALGAHRQDAQQLDDLLPRHLGVDGELADAVPVEPERQRALAVAVDGTTT